MAYRTRTVYPSEQNKGFSSTFQPPEEDGSIQQLKYCNKYGDKDEDNNSNNVNSDELAITTLLRHG